MANYTSKYTGQEIDSLLEKAANITNFTIKDVYLTLEALNAAFPNGDEYAYQVESNRNVYIWSTKNNEWESIGQIEGPQGEAGKDGSAGADGKSAYQSAVDGGYEGTEEEFNEILATAQTQFTQLNESLSKQNRGKQWITNWDWTKPVNQRNITTLTLGTSFTYFLDMWKGLNATVTINSGYVNITSLQDTTYKRITQMFESVDKLEAGKTYTLTLKAKCNTISGSVTLRPCTSTYGGITVPSGAGGVVLTQSNDYAYYKVTFVPSIDIYGFGIEILATNTTSDYFDIDIKGWKLEEGSISTLANDPPQDYGEELTKCQRCLIYYAGDTAIPVSMYDASYFWGIVYLPVPFRTVPTLSSGTVKVYQMPSVTTEITGFTTEYFVKGNVLMVKVYKASHGLNPTNMCIRMNNALFSAEL